MVLLPAFDFEGFGGLESPERICGPLPDQARIRPYFRHEIDTGIPSSSSNSPPKFTAKKLYESDPEPLIFNIFFRKNGCSFYFSSLYQSSKKEGNYPTLLRIRGNCLFTSKRSSKLTVMVHVAITTTNLPQFFNER